MRRLVNLALVLAGAFLFALKANAQFTTVTATVQDPNGIPYVGAVMNAILVPGSSGGYTLSGKPYSGRIGPVALDSTGSFVANFGDVTLITPSGAQWAITIDSAAGTIGLPLGTGPQSFTFTSSGTTISGSSPVSLSTSLNAVAPGLTNINININVTGGGRGSFSGAPLFGSAPAMAVLNCTLCNTSDTIGYLMYDSVVAGTTNPIFETVMKSNGQVETINLNHLGYINSQVGSAGTGEYTSYNSLQIDTVNSGNISILPGSGIGGTGGGDVITKDLLSGPQKGNGTGATLTGTGACATVSLPITAGFVGATTCTGSTGATTLVITPPAVAVPGTTYICGGSDTGLLAGGGGPIAAGAQKGISGSTCTLQWTSVTTNDIVTFWFYAL